MKIKHIEMQTHHRVVQSKQNQKPMKQLSKLLSGYNAQWAHVESQPRTWNGNQQVWVRCPLQHYWCYLEATSINSIKRPPALVSAQSRCLMINGWGRFSQTESRTQLGLSEVEGCCWGHYYCEAFITDSTYFIQDFVCASSKSTASEASEEDEFAIKSRKSTYS